MTALLLLVGTALALDPTILPLQPGTTRLGARLGYDPAPELGVSGTWALPVGDTRVLGLSGEVSVPVFLLSAFDAGEIQARASMPLLEGASNVHLGVDLAAETLDTGQSQLTSLLVGGSVVPGWHGERVVVALPVRYRWGGLSHQAFNAYYLAQVPTAADGWYANTSRFLYLSGLVAARLGVRWELDVEAGARVPGDFGSYGPYLIPWLFNVGVARTMGGCRSEPWGASRKNVLPCPHPASGHPLPEGEGKVLSTSPLPFTGEGAP